MRESRDATLEVDPIPFAAPDRSLTATFIGNATVLFELAGTTVLTDPSFLHAGDHAHVGYGIFAKRLLEPALQPRDLPHLDAVVLSHLHADHWDRVAERALERELPIVTTPQAARALEQRGFTCTIPLDVWKTLELNSPERTDVAGSRRCRHSTGRGRSTRCCPRRTATCSSRRPTAGSRFAST